MLNVKTRVINGLRSFEVFSRQIETGLRRPIQPIIDRFDQVDIE
jgi:hypothetical protein